MQIKENISLKDLTTFKIGGNTRYFAEIETEEDLQEALLFAGQNNLPFFVLGGGSNLLVADAGFEGLVIKIIFREAKIFEENKIETSSGVALSDLVSLALARGLSGLEWALGIPKATLGGALFMNAGAFGANMADITEQVIAFDTTENKFKTFDFVGCQFDYKNSVFKRNKNLIIWQAILKLEKKDKKEIEIEMKRVMAYRQKNHPLEYGSAGSVFKNPHNLPAGEAIEKVGLKGKQIGQAKISEKHSNFIVNLGTATSSDVKALIDLAKKQVKEKLKIDLEEESIYLDYHKL
ncbi:UDP-N-acetylenolpyruvoylglucosamine reductase [bacterium (Candidatus Gribaldobacteria) CG23_combo_of_CG06-09_8_20_14_all_37_87_8]|uniref:UDP-N-acetylenolpyruvoylglucosamine reductase n=2 Tax=Candidatus Gribaldobacteria TaxID=2798536 RepID=A0A2G9ZE22_9BACT|nr:MAG: UDP-N-acetylenolpyruvoylglucosamine reductase [bacterium (Candidatus Gribaldobacteria) CG23_combo_of_CG06-09_8_20_14_all_37_87_8]PIR90418.1 MAG: UDP-N-acetylenolpyruvoylglucosamine reductase [bacterium (Candidatus Gribaldobacteria) CG10_big_fil_rev_8_21_14_0_10_37_21]